MIDSNGIKKYALALGYFDGLHTAHISVIKEAEKMAEEGLIPAVMLFDEHPRKAIFGEDVPFLLQKSKRDEKLAEMGLEVFCLSFENIKDMTPREFVSDIIVKRMNAAAVVCGYNYRFGKNAAGDVSVLRELCNEFDVKVTVCDGYLSEAEEVSSTVIRKAVAEGNMEKASRMLGFPFGFSAEVFSGDKRGRLLGTPTINQFLPEGIAVPLFGVYASKVSFDGKEYIGVTNIGSRPTFEGKSVRSETFIIGYSGDLYGKTVEVKLFSFIRKEKKFPDAEALKRQISADVTAVEEYFCSQNKIF